MAENTEISWADDTFNPWMGCTKVSPACDGCYAEALMDTRYGKVKWGPHGERVRTSPSNWAKPLKWEREQAAVVKEWRAAHAGEEPDMKAWRDCPPTRFVFCASLADVFDNAVPSEWRRDLFDLIRKTPHLTWLLLTKRPGNIVKLFMDIVAPNGAATTDAELCTLDLTWPCNAWAGASIPNQKEADSEIQKLLAAKAALNIPGVFLSMEPLLGSVDLTKLQAAPSGGEDDNWGCNALTGRTAPIIPLGGGEWELDGGGREGPRVDRVITGGETDQGAHRARPSHPDWFRSLRDQCAAAGVPFHHKQNGEWAHSEDRPPPNPGARFFDDEGAPQGDGWHFWADGDRGSNASIKVGKKAAGRLLDGITHDARPEVR